MNIKKVVQTASGKLGKVGIKVKKHSPEILAAVGVVGTVTAAVLACKASTKVSTIIDDARDQLGAVHTAKERYASETNDEGESKYTADDAKKDTAIIFVQTGVKLVKLYAPAVTLGVLSLSCILVSNNILRRRNAALAAAYATVDKSFKDYRDRVKERFGDEVDKQLKYGIKAVELEETVTDENGKEKKTKKTVDVIEGASEYGRYFEAGASEYWESTPDYNMIFLRAQQEYANDLLRANGYVFLNDVYKALGFEPTKAGQIVGWVYDPENPIGDNYVDFGIMEVYRPSADEEMSPTILLDFNVDGNILDYI